MNLKKGFARFEIGGKLRPIKFGTNQTAIFCQLRKCNLKVYQETFTQSKIAQLDIDGSEIRDLLYSGLVSGCMTDKIDTDFNETDVGDWVDDLPEGSLSKIFQLNAESLPPNG